MIRPLAALLALTSLSAPAIAQDKSSPKLIVAISVDQFSADLFAEYRVHFTRGLGRLTQGAVFPSGYQSHAATETCPGHSTILTGYRPAHTGIIANDWYDLTTARADKKIYCVEDEAVPGTDSDNYVVSLKHLRVPTLGDRMKAAIPATRVISVAGKDRAAVLLGGKQADQIWWWGGNGFTSYRGVTETPLVTRVNAGIATMLNQARPAMELPDFCVPHDRAVAVGGRTVGTYRFDRAAGDAKAFRGSPALDASVLVLAAALIEDQKLGRSAQTDLVTIGLSATDVIGHAYGTEGAEMCIQMDALDRELGAFFDRLDTSGVDYEVVLTADHGGQDLPERHREDAAPMAARADVALTPVQLSKAIGAKLGLTGALIEAGGPSGDLYISRTITPAQRKAVADAAVALLTAHPQVAAVFRHADIAATPMPSGPPDTWTLAQEARASFDDARSGDLILLLKPRITPIINPSKGSVATHGSAWTYDRRVPILFWRKSMAGFEQPLSVETVDIMPTLAATIGLPVPAGEIDGRCLDLIAGPADSCPAR